MNPADLLPVVLAAAAGYLVGSIPVTEWIAGSAGVDAYNDGERNPGWASVWRLAGSGWGLLALMGDLSKGVLPVAIATVTWSWGAGWAAGLGALTGACWPAFGRIPGGRGVAALAVFAGAAFALAPPAGIIGVLLALAAAGVASLFGRNGRAVAVAVWIGTYPLLFLAAYPDPICLAALMTLYLVAAIRYATTRRR
jgi:glycerol-3-phosphate acyltransferase PlsY